MEKNIIILAGPTASGKSALALDIAKENPFVIINADSKQVYREIPIITAQPTQEEQQEVPHQLYGVISVAEHCSVADWVDMAKKTLEEVWKNGKVPILVGGTGMYIKSLVEGLSLIPDINEEIRQNARKRLKELGNEPFFQGLQALDPEMAERLNPGDSQRITRAYEVIKQTGKSLAYWQTISPAPIFPDARFLLCFLSPDRQTVYDRCNIRFEQMIEMGLLDEIQTLQAMGLNEELPAMRAHGVPEILQHLNGTMSLEGSIAQAQRNTRHYIKRQFTWFRHQMENVVPLEGTPEQAKTEFLTKIKQFLLTK